MLLATRDLTKTFPGTKALDAVSFDLRAGEVHALLGENGAGKSTLIKCLTGAYRRSSGDILLDDTPIFPQSTLEAQALGIGTVYQEVNLLPNLTVAENLTLGHQPRRFGMIRPRAMRALAEDMLAGYGVDVDVRRPLDHYSVAVQQIVAIARAVHLSGRVLILDEPTASLDAREVQMLFDVIRGLRERGLGIIFISHFLDQVYEISDRLTVLRNGRHIATCAAKDVDRMQLITLMLGHELQQSITSRDNKAAPDPAGAIRFAGVGRRGRIEPFDLSVYKGEVIGMAGLLGAGRTESAEVLFGAVPSDSGSVSDDSGPLALRNPRSAIAAGFGFAPEDRKTDGIIAELSVRENIILALQARQGWARPIATAEQRRIANDYIGRLDIRTPDAEKPVGLLSGGNQQKVILARWLVTHPRFLILDEPTRGIDVGAHAEILRLIEDVVAQGMAILVISSELDELVAVSHRVIVVRDRQHVSELTGSDVRTDTILRAIAMLDRASQDDNPPEVRQ